MTPMIFTKTVLITGICSAILFAFIEPFDMESRVPEVIEKVLHDKYDKFDPEKMLERATQDERSSRGGESSNSRQDDSGDTSSSQDSR